ncbi:MAG TPA: STAS domain-containing protein [Gemmatimonadaceae bacterium]|jgi:anti-sigma B factor antagonist
MSVRSTRQGDTTLIQVEGQLVAGNRQQLREAVTSEIDRGVRNFVIDFSDTGYVDSAGLGALVSLSKKVREADGSLRLTNLNDDLRTLFELTRLDTLFALGQDDSSTSADLTVRPNPPRPGDTSTRQRDDDDARA